MIHEVDIASSEFFMTQAIVLAQRAAHLGEVPVGAVVVKDGVVIGRGFNQPITSLDPCAHAEIMALRDAAKNQQNYRLQGCLLYVTLEPCTMCVGAMLHARIGYLVYATTEPKAGAVDSHLQLLRKTHFNHLIQVQGGVMADKARSLLSDFFKQRRQQHLFTKDNSLMPANPDATR